MEPSSFDRPGVPDSVVDAALDVWGQSGERTLISITGRSMLPLLRAGDKVLVAHGYSGVRRGDVIVFRRDGRLIAHRVLRTLENDSGRVFVTKGDNARDLDAPLGTSEIVGRVLAVRRGDRQLSLDTNTWRRIGWCIAVMSLAWTVLYKRARFLKRKWLGRKESRVATGVRRASVGLLSRLLGIPQAIFGRWEVEGKPAAVPAGACGPSMVSVFWRDGMVPENALLYICARQAFVDTHWQHLVALCSQHQVDWNAVFSAAQSHGVAPLVYANLQRYDTAELALPEHILTRFKLCAFNNAILQENRKALLVKALEYLATLDIDVMLVKKVALDLSVYTQPWYTISDDVDLVLRRTQDQMSASETKELRSFFHRTGIEYDFFTHHDIVLNGVLSMNFHRIWNDAVAVAAGGPTAFVMSNEDTLISLCTNSCRKRFFRLKTLCDIAEFIALRTDLNWEKVATRAKEDDVSNIVYTALFAAQSTVGCELPDGALRALSVNSVKARVIRFLVRYTSTRVPLTSLYPYASRGPLGRKINASLLLPYLVYRPSQLWRRLKHLVGEARVRD
jgi:hypothetical protein